MRSKASCRAIPESFAPAWTFPSPMGRRRSKSAAQSRTRWSFDVLHLFAQFFNLSADFQRQPGDAERFAFDPRRFREHRVRFAMHFLKQEVELLAEFAGAIEEFRKLLQMAPQAVELFTNVAALREQRSFLRQARRFDPAAAQQFFQPILQSPSERRRQTDREFPHFVGLLAYLCEPRAQLFGEMSPFGVAHLIELRERFAQTILERGTELILLLVCFGQRRRKATDYAREPQQRYNIEVSLYLHLLAQFFGSVGIGLQQLLIHLHRRRSSRLHVHVHVEMAAVNFLANDLTEPQFIDVEPFRHPEANVEKTVIDALHTDAQGPTVGFSPRLRVAGHGDAFGFLSG